MTMRNLESLLEPRSVAVLGADTDPGSLGGLALAVIVENSGFGARAAAPIARQVFDYYLLGKEPPRPAEDDDSAPQH